MKRVLDFIVVGAQRSGTTSLFAYLREHPEIAVPPGKEVPYFTHARHRVSWEEYMRSLFAGTDPGKRWGTVTPQYMVGGLTGPVPDTIADPGNPRNVPERIRERAPDARLIAILRDPIERACSHHDWACEVGWENRPFDQAIADMLRPQALASARARPAERTGYISWGEYGRILAGYFAVFPREQMLVIYTTELKEDPAEVMRRVFEFVGVADDFVPPNLGAVYRATAAAPGGHRDSSARSTLRRLQRVEPPSLADSTSIGCSSRPPIAWIRGIASIHATRFRTSKRHRARQVRRARPRERPYASTMSTTDCCWRRCSVLLHHGSPTLSLPDPTQRSARGSIRSSSEVKTEISSHREVASMPKALEIEIADIWKEILGVQHLAPENDFFEIGGSSFHAARVVTKTRAAFGVKLSAHSLFEHPTLVDFAAHVRSADPSPARP